MGASDDSAKWGHILARRALSSRGDRTVLLVNRRGGEVLGEPAYPSAEAAAAARDLRVDLAVLCVPAEGFVASVADAVAAGARAIVGITAGLSEAGAEGARLEAEALAIARGRRRGAGRSQLPRGRRHHDRAPAGARRAPCR